MKILFITGASRSGTTMLNRILGGNSLILGLNELHYFGELCNMADATQVDEEAALVMSARQLLSRIHHNIFYAVENETLYQLQSEAIVSSLASEKKNLRDLFPAVLEYYALECNENNIEYVTDQTPRNIYYAGDLLDLYPECRIIHIIRDPRAVLASQKNRWLQKFYNKSSKPWMETIRNFINYHPYTMSRLWLKSTHLAKKNSSHERFKTVIFENLVNDPESTVKKLCDFLDLSYQDDMLDVPQVGSSIRANTGSRGISNETLYSWKKVLNDAEINIAEHYIDKSDMNLPYSKVKNVNRLKIFVYKMFYMLVYPLHLGMVILINPKRFLVQLKGFLK